MDEWVAHQEQLQQQHQQKQQAFDAFVLSDSCDCAAETADCSCECDSSLISTQTNQGSYAVKIKEKQTKDISI